MVKLAKKWKSQSPLFTPFVAENFVLPTQKLGKKYK
nr:MAG TPA: hypothetical protein [Caudoviricetes sp.]